MKTLVAYHSRSGRNRFIAERLAENLGADMTEIRPRCNGLVCVLLETLMGFGLSIHPLDKDPAGYDRLIICAPIYMGQVIMPVRSVVKRHANEVRELYFVTCCSSEEKDANEQYGYNTVFSKLRKLLKGREVVCEAFPFQLAMPTGIECNEMDIMNKPLTEENYRGRMSERVEGYIETIKQSAE